MHDHSSRLVDDNDVVILVDDVERKGLGSRRWRDRIGDIERDAIAGPQHGVGLRRSSADLHEAAFDQALKLRAGVSGERTREKAVEPLAGLIVRHVELDVSHVSSPGTRARAVAALRPPTAPAVRANTA